MNHTLKLTDSAELPRSFSAKKPGEENEFFSRVEVNLRKNGSVTALLWRSGPNVSFCRMLFS
jgi:hypothetical protein